LVCRSKQASAAGAQSVRPGAQPQAPAVQTRPGGRRGRRRRSWPRPRRCRRSRPGSRWSPPGRRSCPGRRSRPACTPRRPRHTGPDRAGCRRSAGIRPPGRAPPRPRTGRRRRCTCRGRRAGCSRRSGQGWWRCPRSRGRRPPVQAGSPRLPSCSRRGWRRGRGRGGAGRRAGRGGRRQGAFTGSIPPPSPAGPRLPGAAPYPGPVAAGAARAARACGAASEAG